MFVWKLKQSFQFGIVKQEVNNLIIGDWVLVGSYQVLVCVWWMFRVNFIFLEGFVDLLMKYGLYFKLGIVKKLKLIEVYIYVVLVWVFLMM